MAHVFEASTLAKALRRTLARRDFDRILALVRKAGDIAGECREYTPEDTKVSLDAWTLLSLAEALEGQPGAGS